MKCRKNTVRSLLIFLIITGFVALESGSMFQMIYASEINRFNFLILLVLGFCILAKRGRNAFAIKKNYVNLFIAIIICTSLIDILIWNEINYYILYCANIASFIICYILSEKIPYSIWRSKYLNVLFVFAAVSLIGWCLRDKLLAAPFGFDFEGTWQYKSFIIFNIIKAIPIRNCGIFWEPGMYQGFLNFGILLILIQKRKTLFDYLKVVVFALSVLTTFSTTGYAILLVLSVYAIYRILSRFDSKVAGWFVMASFMMFILTDGFSLLFDWAVGSLPSILTDKIVNENASFSTRIYSGLFDIYLGVRNPFGVGRSSVTELINSLAKSYSVTVTARTSTIATAFVYYGVIGGIAYSIMWVRGLIRVTNKKFIDFVIQLLIMFLILNNEPMLFHLFFGTIMFYWNKEHDTEDEKYLIE